MSSKTATKAKMPPFDVADHICFAVYSAGHAFTRAYKPLLDELGLTYPQYLVMLSLWAQDDPKAGVTVGEIGAKLFLESSTLTPLLKRLEALGFVTRKRDPEDERQVRVRLTDKGSTLRKKSAEVTACIRAASGMEVDAIMKLRGQITTLRDNLMKNAAA